MGGEALNPFEDVFAEAHGRALMAFLRVMGGEAEVHARDFGLSRSEWTQAVRRLEGRGKIARSGECRWRLSA